MSIKEWLRRGFKQLTEADISSARLDAELILAHVLGQPREFLIAHSNDELSAGDTQKADELIKQRAQRHPLVHLTGQREFYGLDLEITPDVLTPRVETERMVELVIDRAPRNGSLLDVGTGSGAICIAIAKSRSDIQISASDVSSRALQVANRNCGRYEVAVSLFKSDLLDQVTGQFDVITANLPYLTDDADLMPEVTHEPRVALVGGIDGLELYRRFFGQLSGRLNPNGYVLIEADPWQHQALADMAVVAKLELLIDDYFIMMFRFTQ